jgi:hypothetical protein
MIVSFKGKSPSASDLMCFAPPMQYEVLDHPSVHWVGYLIDCRSTLCL